MRKNIKSGIGTALAAICILLTSAFILPHASTLTDSTCGVFALGDQKLDLASGKTTLQLASKDELITAIKSGVSFSGSGECVGQYEITALDLVIYTDKEDVKYNYDLNMLRQMQSMEDYMLNRYFIDARTLTFRNVRAQGADGSSIELPVMSYTVK